MSRIGKNPVQLPDGVSASLSGQIINIKGPKGELSFTLSDNVSAEIDNGSVIISPRSLSKQARQLWGMSRTMVANSIEGVTKGFRKELNITGVGYRAQLKGNDLSLALGLSHDVVFSKRDGLTVSVPAPNRIVIEGIDKQKVGQFAAEIRRMRPPEPYKGKGLRYEGEVIHRKVGKKK